MSYFSALVAITVAVAVDAQRWYEPPVATGYEYLMVLSPKRNRGNAKIECERTGGYGTDLATIQTQATNDFLFSLSPYTEDKRWIGLQRTGDGCQTEWDTWRWDDGSPVDLNGLHWFVGEPSNYNCNEKCVMQGTSASGPTPIGGWNDAKCRSKAGYICQRPLPVPVHETQVITFTNGCGGANAAALHSAILTSTTVQSACNIQSDETEAVNVDGGLVFFAARQPSTTAAVYQSLTEHMSGCAVAVIGAATGVCNLAISELTVAQTCTDGLQNGDEAGVDCSPSGGACEECVNRGDVGNSGGDPHFVVKLPTVGNLCYDVHGSPGQYLNLITTDKLLVNSLVVKAPASVDGTYHGAIGVTSTTDDHKKQDHLVVLADGTVQFNGQTMMVRKSFNSTTNLLGSSVKVSVTASGVYAVVNGDIQFSIRFVDGKKDRQHLDFAIDKFPSESNGATHGIIGQFLSARSELQSIDASRSLLSVNGKSVDVLKRPLPQTASGASGTCYKYFDSQAEGLLAGSVGDYVTGGMFDAPMLFNHFHQNVTRRAGRVDRFVAEISRQEQNQINVLDITSKTLLKRIHVSFTANATTDELRNSVIAATSKRSAISIEELQSYSTAKILQMLEASL